MFYPFFNRFGDELGKIVCPDAAPVLEAAEHALDDVAASVKHFGKTAFPAAVRLERDIGNGALLLDQMAGCIGVMGFVVEHDGRGGQRIKEEVSGLRVGRIAAGQEEAEWSPAGRPPSLHREPCPATAASNGQTEDFACILARAKELDVLLQSPTLVLSKLDEVQGNGVRLTYSDVVDLEALLQGMLFALEECRRARG